MFHCFGITEKGIVSHNEDALLIGRQILTEGTTEMTLRPPFFAAVSDGVSGENSGELASRLTLARIRDIQDINTVSIKNSLMDVHRQLAEYSRDDPDKRNMQATLCGFAVGEDGSAVAFNVGDSRLYRFREGQMRQLSRDQSLVQLLYEEGSITHEERKTHVHRNIIFPAFGNLNSDPIIDAENIEGGIEYGDVLILCSDGLSDFLSAYDMQEILSLPKSIDKRLTLLVKAALLRGGDDNISVLAVTYEYE